MDRLRTHTTTGHTPRAERPPARGLTLIELLVVMTILVLLVGAVLPVLSPANDGRRIREASRAINTFLAGAQARATQTGRPFGVMFKKLSQETGSADDNAVCLELYYVEEPPPYAGLDENSRVMIGTDQSEGAVNQNQVRVRFVRFGNEVQEEGLRPDLDADLFPSGVLRRGDRIVVSGHELEITDSTDDVDRQGFYLDVAGEPDGTLFAQPVEQSGWRWSFLYDNEGNRLTDIQQGTPQPYWTEPLRYQVRRLPTLTSAPPLQLPEGTAIDLRASGTDEIVFHRDEDAVADKTSNNSPPIVMFSPEGAVSRLFAVLDDPAINGDDVDRLFSGPLSSSVYFLIGLRENIPTTTETDFSTFAGTDSELQAAKAKINWLGGDSRWVSIGGQTGSVTTAENAFVNPVAVANENNGATLPQRRDIEIVLARELAAQKASEGGR